MSFTFNWPRFSDQFHYDAIQMLNTALNKGNKPPIIADKIEVVELEMGTQPPELEIRDIGDLTVDQFRGIFRLTYAGDAHLVLKTKVQANPLNHKQPDIHLMAGSRGMLAAKHPLVVPMLLRLSHFRLSSYVVLVVSKQKGITLVFKTDPLQNVDINSTFDSIAVIQNFIQREIEGQLRQMFREDLPGIIHRLSQQWVKAKVEAPYLSKRPPIPQTRLTFDALSTPDISSHRPLASDIGLHPHLSRKASSTSLGSRKPRSASGSVTSASRPPQPPAGSSPQSLLNDPSTSSHPDLENFDPTYGLRPEGLPTKSVFKGFSSLFTPNKGLADLAEEPEPSEQDDDEYDDDEAASFDFVDWGDEPVGTSPPSSLNERDREREREIEYETIPAVGGGTITRPRVFHSQSVIQTHASANLPPPLTRPASSSSLTGMGSVFRSGLATPALSMLSRHPSAASNPFFPEYPSAYPRGYSYGGQGPHSSRMSSFNFGSAAPSVSSMSIHAPPRSAPPIGHGYRPPSPESLESRSQPSRSSSGPTRTLSTVPTEHTPYDEPPFASSSSHHAGTTSTYAPSIAPHPHVRRPLSERRLSITSTTSTSNTHAEFLSTSPSPSHMQLPHLNGHPHAKIVLRPSLNDSIHQLSTLSHSNHTLSPYTRDLSHFTVRSVPPRGLGVLGGGPYGYGASGERQPVKAKRKRTYRLGGKKPVAADASAVASSSAGPSGQGPTARKDLPRHPSSPAPPSEFDAEDMDRYFRSYDYDEPSSPRSATAPRGPPSTMSAPPLRTAPAPSSSLGIGSRTLRQRPLRHPT